MSTPPDPSQVPGPGAIQTTDKVTAHAGSFNSAFTDVFNDIFKVVFFPDRIGSVDLKFVAFLYHST